MYENARYHSLEHGAVVTRPQDSFPRRLEIIFDAVYAVMKQYNPEAMSLEKLFFANNKNHGHRGGGSPRGSSCWRPKKRGCPCLNTPPCKLNRR